MPFVIGSPPLCVLYVYVATFHSRCVDSLLLTLSCLHVRPTPIPDGPQAPVSVRRHGGLMVTLASRNAILHHGCRPSIAARLDWMVDEQRVDGGWDEQTKLHLPLSTKKNKNKRVTYNEPDWWRWYVQSHKVGSEAGGGAKNGFSCSTQNAYAALAPCEISNHSLPLRAP